MHQILVSVNDSNWLSKNLDALHASIANGFHAKRISEISERLTYANLRTSAVVVNGIMRAEVAKLTADDLVDEYADVTHILIPASVGSKVEKTFEIKTDTQNGDILSLPYESVGISNVPRFREVTKYGVSWFEQLPNMRVTEYVVNPACFSSVILSAIIGKRYLSVDLKVTNRQYANQLVSLMCISGRYTHENGRLKGKRVSLTPMYHAVKLVD